MFDEIVLIWLVESLPLAAGVVVATLLLLAGKAGTGALLGIERPLRGTVAGWVRWLMGKTAVLTRRPVALAILVGTLDAAVGAPTPRMRWLTAPEEEKRGPRGVGWIAEQEL